MYGALLTPGGLFEGGRGEAEQGERGRGVRCLKGACGDGVVTVTV